MILESVTLENFKKHTFLEVNFNEGINLIVGNNYAGKSTVVQACMLALLGNSAVEGQTSDLISTGTTTFKVTLKLSNGFTIERTPKNSTVYDPENKTVVRTHTAVNLWVSEMLNVTKNTFNKVFCSAQGSPQALLQMEGAELQRFIEVCLGVDDMDIAVKRANAEERTTQAKVEANQEYLLTPETFAELQLTIPARETLITESKEVIGYRDSNILEYVEERDKVKGEIKLQEKINSEHEKYLVKIETLTKQLDELGEPGEEKSIVELDEFISSVDKLLTDAASAQNELDFLEKQENKAKRNLVEYDNAIEFFKENFPEECSSLAEREEVGRLELAFNAKTDEMNRLSKAIRSGACGECGRAFEGEDNLEELKADLQKLKLEREILQDEVGVAESVYVFAQSKAVKYRSAEENFRDATTYKTQTLANLKDYADQRASLGIVPEDYTNGELQRGKDGYLRERRQIVDHNASVREATRFVVAAKAGLAELVKPEGVSSPVKNMEIRVAGMEQKIGAEYTAKAVLEQTISSESIALDREKLLMDRHREVMEKVLDLQLIQSDYKAISETISSIRKKVIDNGFNQIMAIASEFVSACTGGDISEVALSETGIRYVEDGTSFGKVNASGAQKSLIGLGMKLGIAQIVPSPFGCMLLDEVSADMDEEISLACLTVMGDYNQQAIIVSHRAMDVADNMIEL